MKNSTDGDQPKKDVGWPGFCGSAKKIGNNDEKDGCENQVFETELFASALDCESEIGASVDNCGAGCGSQVAGR